MTLVVSYTSDKRVFRYIFLYRNERGNWGRRKSWATGVRVLTVNYRPSSLGDNFHNFLHNFPRIWKYLSIATCNSYRCRITAVPAASSWFYFRVRLARKRRHYRNPLDSTRRWQLQPPIDPDPRRCTSGISRKNSRQGKTSTPSWIRVVEKGGNVFQSRSKPFSSTILEESRWLIDSKFASAFLSWLDVRMLADRQIYIQ